MKVVLSCLLLASLCALSSWSVPSERLDVEQRPDISIEAGETANITCCWSWNFTQVRVDWMKNQTLISSKLHSRNSTNQSDKNGNTCSNLVFVKITKEHSGKYICLVTLEIPSFVKKQGNGTVVTVTTKEDKNKGTDAPDNQLPVVIVPAVLVPSLLVALACFCKLKRKQAASIIYEVPHVDSEVEKHSTSSSRGSSEWCHVSVYESLDYFERVETKESG